MESLEALIEGGKEATSPDLDRDRGLGVVTHAFFIRTHRRGVPRPAEAGAEGAEEHEEDGAEAAATPRQCPPDVDIWWAAVWTSMLNMTGASASSLCSASDDLANSVGTCRSASGPHDKSCQPLPCHDGYRRLRSVVQRLSA